MDNKKQMAANLGLNNNELVHRTTKEAKNDIKKAVIIKMKLTIKQTGEGKSKYTFLTTNTTE